MSQISCMSFNILACDTHSSGWELPRERFPYIMDTIRMVDPDLLGMQEACDHPCPQMEKREERGCAGWNWCDIMLENVCALGYEGVALRDLEGIAVPRMTIGSGLIIFYKKDRFEKLDAGCQSYAHDPNRHFQWVKLHDKKYDRDILFTNTHFSINGKLCGERSAVAGDAYRTTEAAKLLQFWYKNCDENTALFATGDYNSRPESTAQQLLRSKQFKPSQIIAKVWDERGSMHMGKSATTIDYCYVNTTAQTVKEYKVMANRYDITDVDTTRFPRAGYASDHRAIVTYCDYKELVTEEN